MDTVVTEVPGREQHAANAPRVGRPAPVIPPRTARAHRITSDAEAITIARELAAGLAPGAAARDRERRLPVAEIDRYSHSGLWGLLVPRGHGGPDVSAVTLAEVTAIISQADASIGQIPQNHHYMVEALRLAGTDTQLDHWFARVLDGDRLGNAYTEIGTRTPKDFRTRLLRDGDGYVLTGQKFYSTGALFAHVVVAVALDEADRTVLALLERDTEGLRLIDDWSGIGQRTTGSGTTLFDAVRVAPSRVVPHQDLFERPTPMGPVAQLIHAAVDVGIARAALADTLAFTRQHARPWFETDHARGADDPHVIAAAGELVIRVNAANALLERAGHAVDAARADPTERSVAEASIAVAEARALSTEVSLHVASKLFELAGSRATLEEHGYDRHWRNARTHTLHDPVRYKYVNVGNYYLNDVIPPRHGAL
jgi:SfnB family sulfur acquisition oxidoreductase